MKKLRLNLQQLNNAEVLTRSQLRNVLGGVAQTTGTCTATCSAGGSWSYSGYPTFEQICQDGYDYCSSGQVTLSSGCNAPIPPPPTP